MNILNLTNEEDAYFYGLLLTDGHAYLTTRNRGRISLELIDQDIIQKIFKKYGGSTNERTRNTNFKDNHTSYSWKNYQFEFRNELFTYGFPAGDKQYLQDIPKVDFNQKGFWRGVIDGNGSLGMTRRNIPFLSLGTKSELLKNNWEMFLLNNFGIIKKNNRNVRDNFYNILITKEDAQKVSFYLYNNSTLNIKRKYESYLSIMKWKRPLDMKKLCRAKSWNKNEDYYVLNHSIENSCKELERSESSIKNRVFRLKHGEI